MKRSAHLGPLVLQFQLASSKPDLLVYLNFLIITRYISGAITRLVPFNFLHLCFTVAAYTNANDLTAV